MMIYDILIAIFIIMGLIFLATAIAFAKKFKDTLGMPYINYQGYLGWCLIFLFLSGLCFLVVYSIATH